MMRVLVLTSLFPSPLQPNRAPFNRQQIAALGALHHVRVIAPIAWTGEWSVSRSHDAAIEWPADRRVIRDGMIVHHPRYYFTPKVLRGTYGTSYAASVRSTFIDAVREHRPDVVLGCWAYPDGWAAMHLAREAGLPVVIKVQGSDLLQVGDSGPRYDRAKEAIAGADAVIAVSQHLRARAIALGASASRSHVVYNGLDTARFVPGCRTTARLALGVSGPEPLITFVGNLVPVKGVDVLLKALEVLKDEGVAFSSAIVGDGPLRGAIERDIRARGLVDRVRLIGSCSLERMPLWHQAADVLVLPSRSEGIPNVLREAAACGTPIVASNVGGVPEVASEASMIPAGDFASLAQKISDVLQHRGTGAGPMTQGPAVSTWGESALAVASVLQSVVNVSTHQVKAA
jgi:glycosyltransferase involved in cell wall biosynthesis